MCGWQSEASTILHTRTTPADVTGDRRTTARALADRLYLLVKVGSVGTQVPENPRWLGLTLLLSVAGEGLSAAQKIDVAISDSQISSGATER